MRIGQITQENYQTYAQLFKNNGGKTKSGGNAGGNLADLSALVSASLTGGTKPRGADTVSLNRNWGSAGAVFSGKVPAKAVESAGDPFYYRNRFTPAVFTKTGGGTTLSFYQSHPGEIKASDLQKIQKPDWDSGAFAYVTRNHEHLSEEEYVAAIKELARKDFAAGICGESETFYNLRGSYISTVSPDRQAIYAESMQKTGGYMNLGCAFFTEDGQKVINYNAGPASTGNPKENRFSIVFTKEENARDQQFFKMYLDEWQTQRDKISSSSPKNDAQVDIQVDIKATLDIRA